MKLYILDRVIEYDNDNFSIDSILGEIDRILGESGYYFSHVTVDGVDIYQDYYDYFLDNIKNINDIYVISKTMKEFAEDIMLSTIDYIDRAIPQIGVLSEEFYKNPAESSWNKLSELLEGIKWILDSFAAIDNNKNLEAIINSYEAWNLYAKDIYALQELLKELEEVLNNEDMVSMADILIYEVTPLFKSMKEDLLGMISRGDN